MEEVKGGQTQKTGSTTPRRRRGTNRAAYNSWASQRAQGGVTHPTQYGNREQALPPLRDNLPDNDAGSLPNSNSGGLNSIRQLVDSIDNDIEEVDTDVTRTENAGNLQNDSNRDDRRGGGIPLAPPQRPPRARGRRRPNRNFEAGGRSDGLNPNSRGGRNVSPQRHMRHYPGTGPRIPAMRFTTNVNNTPSLHPALSPTLSDQGSSQGLYTPFGPMGHSGNFSGAIITGLGTEEEPYELSPGLPDVPSSPTAFHDRSSGNLLSDEEIARQLQHEEWEAASNYGDLNNTPSLSPMFVIPHRPNRAADLPPLRGRGGQSRGAQALPYNSRYYAAHMDQADIRSRGPARSHRPLNSTGLHSQDYIEYLLLTQGQNSPEGEMGFLIDLMSSYGLSLNEIHNLMDLGPVGSQPRGELGNYESLLALAEEIGEVSRGISRADINRLPTVKHKTTEVETEAAAAAKEPLQCHICLSDYENGDEKRLLPCKHDFHKSCVDKWLESNATCPICRSEVKPKKS